jgi:hypothetical protein
VDVLRLVVRRVKAEPAIVTQALGVALTLAVALGLPLTDQQNGAILAAVAAVVNVALALAVRAVTQPLLQGAVNAVIALVLAFGFSVSPEVQGIVLSLTLALGGVAVRQTVTPEVKLPPLAGPAPLIPDEVDPTDSVPAAPAMSLAAPAGDVADMADPTDAA